MRGLHLRPARPDDVPGLLAVKRSLRMAPGAGETSRGGFLLGADADAYRQAIHRASTWVLADADGVQGFAIVLPDPVFRAGPIFARRDRVRWRLDDLDRLLAGRLAYYDQLAVRRGGPLHRRWGAALALAALWPVIETHDHLVTTTVLAPVRNLAAVPYLKRVGGRPVGDLDEVYPEIGPLVSQLWLAERGHVLDRLRHPRGRAEAWLVETARAALDRARAARAEGA